MNILLSPRRRTLLASAHALAALLAAAAFFPFNAAHAATRRVTTCVDGGFGSLRDALRIAVSGDTIDMTGLTCSRITLTRGQLRMPQTNLTLIGPGRFALTIDGANATQMFSHSGNGTLRIDRMSIANGRQVGAGVTGACVFSMGRIELIRSRVHHCAAVADNALEPFATGGAVYAWQEVSLSRSAVFSSSATDSGGGITSPRVTLYYSQVYGNEAGEGGGISTGELVATYSLIHGNRSSGNGAGVWANAITVNKSTVSNNVSRFGSGGGIYSTQNVRKLIIDSTISGNSASSAGALYVPSGDTSIINSTVVLNHDVQTSPGQPCIGAIDAGPRALHVESSILALSTCNTGPAYDIGGLAAFPYPVIGKNNLIGSSRMAVPPDTISADPRIAPLAENGGSTRTHMLLADSPAINRGNNDFDREFDQRGPGFPRVKGAFPDIGSIER